jgi:shikimate kinase
MSIVLIGYRGSGKTTVGRALAERLGWPFVDADAVIVERAGMTIAQVFQQRGEAAFRAMESAVVREMAGRRGHVIALGGGAVLAAETRAALAAAGHPVVYLRGTPDELHRRITADPATADARPNLTPAGGVDEVRNLLAIRDEVYRSAMTHELDVVGRTVDELANALVPLKEHQPQMDTDAHR